MVIKNNYNIIERVVFCLFIIRTSEIRDTRYDFEPFLYHNFGLYIYIYTYIQIYTINTWHRLENATSSCCYRIMVEGIYSLCDTLLTTPRCDVNLRILFISYSYKRIISVTILSTIVKFRVNMKRQSQSLIPRKKVRYVNIWFKYYSRTNFVKILN